MAKKSTAKKSAAKKTAVKASKGKKTAAKKTAKAAAKPKKTAVKKTAAKSAAKKTSEVKKTSTAKKTAAAKKTTKLKTTARKTVKKSTMPRKTTKKKTAEKAAAQQEVMSTAEARAIAIKKIKGYSQKDLEHFREIILEKRDEIIEQLQNLKDQMLDPTTGEYINENSPYSLHMAEQGTDAMEREKTFLYAQRENKFLGYLEDALKRIDAGTYGICIECIEEPQHLCDTCPLVPKARLEAVPHSQLCLPIKQRQEKR